MNDQLSVTTGNLGAPARHIIGLLCFMESLGVSKHQAAALFRAVGLPEKAFDKPDYPISPHQELEVYAEFIKAQPAPASPIRLALEVAQCIDLSRYGMIGLLVQHAPNMLEGIKLTFQYAQLAWGHCRQTLKISDHNTTISVTMDRPRLPGISEPDVDKLVTMHIAATVFIACKCNYDMMGQQAAPSRLELPFPQPDDWIDTDFSPACPIIFNQDQAGIVYEFDVRKVRPPRASPHFFKLYRNQAEALARALQEETSFTERVRQMLWAYTPSPSRSECATYLGVTERSLARKLQQEGTSYKEIFADVQTERSQNMLRQRQMTIAQISEKLGYSDPAAFSRAFYAWTGLSPKGWREAASKHKAS